MQSPLRKDLAISVLGHISLIAIIIIVNPATGVLRGSPEVMTVGLAGLEGPAPAPAREEVQQQAEEQQPEAEPIDPPEIPITAADESFEESFKLASNDSLETIVDEPEPEPEPEKPKPEKPKPKPAEQTQARTESKPPAAKPIEDTGPKEVTSSAGKGLDITSAVGEGDGAGGSGSGGSGGFGLPYNISMLERKIERSWRNPVTSSNQVTCTIYFQIARDGQLIGRPVVEKSSGITTFDNEAVYAIMRVDQFPAFPSGFEYDYIGIHLDFAYVP
ncbi:MAG: TonB family protein [bacterium]